MNFENETKKIEKIIGYTFSDKSLLIQAFTRTSFCNENRRRGVPLYHSNEVLEFFGDSILSSAIVTLFINEYSERYEYGIKTKFAEGDFTVIKSRLSDKKNLSERIRELQLGKYLRMGEGDSKLGIAEEASVLEDLFESIVGAVYIDSGMNMKTVIALVSRMLDIKKVISREESCGAPNSERSAKNRLQEWCADKKRRLPSPVYKTVGESGPEHKKIYERACFIGERQYAIGRGKNLKAADMDAAEKTLEILIKNEGRVTKNDEQEKLAPLKLREMAKREDKPLPVFRDLGESENSTPHMREYMVVCIYSGTEKIGVANDKCTARQRAAMMVLEEIEKTKSKAKKPPRVKKTNKKAK